MPVSLQMPLSIMQQEFRSALEAQGESLHGFAHSASRLLFMDPAPCGDRKSTQLTHPQHPTTSLALVCRSITELHQTSGGRARSAAMALSCRSARCAMSNCSPGAIMWGAAP